MAASPVPEKAQASSAQATSGIDVVRGSQGSDGSTPETTATAGGRSADSATKPPHVRGQSQNAAGAERMRWTQEAWNAIDPEELRQLVRAMVEVPSPTGEERPLAELIVDQLAAVGARSRVQPLDARQANAIGRLPGSGDGADLLLYAPIDTVLAGNAEEDLPWAAPEARTDIMPVAEDRGPYVVGLGAGNPKGHAACIVGALAALHRAGVPLRGTVLAGFGAGGMPTNARPQPLGDRRNTGQGVGCSFLLEQGIWPDAAVIAKPGWTVSYEEVGLCWFQIDVEGTHTYVGSRHRLPYRNAIDEAAYVVSRLESWFEVWAARHESGLVRPQGVVGAISGGWSRMPSFPPAVCRLLVDLRISPRTTPAEARRQITAAVQEIVASRPGLQAHCEMVLSIPGSHTSPDSFVVRSTVAAWEQVTGAVHRDVDGTSGATDANILRNRGIPTARVGMPKVTDAPFDIDFELGMNICDIRDMVQLTKVLCATVVDVCTRPDKEVFDE